MWDKDYGGYIWNVDNSGSRKAGDVFFKDLYGQAFGLFATCEYAKAAVNRTEVGREGWVGG